jgi:hypothetical protein
MSKTEDYKEKRLDRLFMEYLDIAIGSFENPHNKTNSDRLKVYRDAFHEVVGPHLINDGFEPREN